MAGTTPSSTGQSRDGSAAHDQRRLVEHPVSRRCAAPRAQREERTADFAGHRPHEGPGHPQRRGTDDREVRLPRPQTRLITGGVDDENPRAHTGTARQDGCLLARRELSRRRPDLSLRQSAAEAAPDARGCEAHAPGALGHDPRAELHLRSPESRDQEVRPRHDLRVRPRTRRPGRRGQHVSRGHVQRDLSRHQPGRGGAAKAVSPVLVSRRYPEPRLAGVPGLDPRGWRAGLFAQSFVRGGLRQSRPDRCLRRRRRRGGDRSARHRMALEQVPRSGHRRRRAADPAPQRLQDLEPDGPRPHHPGGAGGVPPGMRVDTHFRRGPRARADAPGDGCCARRGGGADQEHPAGRSRPRQPHTSAVADDRPQFPEGLDGTEDRGWPSDRGHVPGPPDPGRRLGHDSSRTPQAAGGLAQELPAGRTVRRAGSPERGAGRACAQGRTAHGSESPRQRRHAPARPQDAGFPRIRGRRAHAPALPASATRTCWAASCAMWRS